VAPHPIEHCHGRRKPLNGQKAIMPRCPGGRKAVLYLRRIEGLRGIRHSAASHPPSIGHACVGPR
jgi:hypothetical protein